MDRRTGRTTRMVDEMIQVLFTKGNVELAWMHPDMPLDLLDKDMQDRDRVVNVIRRRVKLEHPHVDLLWDKQRNCIFLESGLAHGVAGAGIPSNIKADIINDVVMYGTAGIFTKKDDKGNVITERVDPRDIGKIKSAEEGYSNGPPVVDEAYTIGGLASGVVKEKAIKQYLAVNTDQAPYFFRDWGNGSGAMNPYRRFLYCLREDGLDRNWVLEGISNRDVFDWAQGRKFNPIEFIGESDSFETFYVREPYLQEALSRDYVAHHGLIAKYTAFIMELTSIDIDFKKLAENYDINPFAIFSYFQIKAGYEN